MCNIIYETSITINNYIACFIQLPIKDFCNVIYPDVQNTHRLYIHLLDYYIYLYFIFALIISYTYYILHFVNFVTILFGCVSEVK